MVPAVGRPARRAVFFGNDGGVRSSRQHLRLRAHRRRRGRAVRGARGVPGRAALRPLVAGPALRPRSRAARARRARRAAAEGDGDARQSEARAISARSRRIPPQTFALLDRFVRANIMASEDGPSQSGVHPGPGLVRLPVRRAGPPERAGLVSARDDVQLGDEPARQAAEHGLRAHGREACRSQRTAHRQPARRGHRGAAAGRGRTRAVRPDDGGHGRARSLLGLRRRDAGQADGRHLAHRSQRPHSVGAARAGAGSTPPCSAR